ncbi:hypothetical protein F1880_009959 [Penicillium rolfsii]|nr:hypothetical protein F1880_009959 [Penicillium rolfsii]
MKRSSQPIPPSQFRRKNGQQSSCENCRKSKLACDHAKPHCGRCVRLERTDTCVYLVSPLAKSSPLGATPQGSAVAKRSTKGRVRPLSQGVSASQSYASPEISPDDVANVAQDWPQTLRFEGASSNRLEAPSQTTTWDSIFKEFNLDVELGVSAPYTDRDLSLSWKDPEILQHATRALTLIPSRAVCEALLKHAVNYPDFGCHEPYLRLLHDGWWDSFEGSLGKDPSPMSTLEPVIQQIWANTAGRSIDHLQFDSREWLQMRTGSNTTWDALAYLMSAYGSACAGLLPYHPLLADHNKSQLCGNIGKGIRACLSLCEAQDVCSVNLVNAHASMLLLQNSCDGDDCTSPCRNQETPPVFLPRCPYPSGNTLLGTNALTAKQNLTNIAHLARLVISTGLHLGTVHLCFIQTQLEHKAFHRAFAMDKSIATSQGSPPQLTRRFNQCPLPLELSDEQLQLSGNELALTLSQLDSNGWSTRECSYPVSYLRALSMLGNYREEILELTMGPSVASLEDMQARLYICTDQLNREIVDQLKITYTGLPQRLQYNPNDHANLAPFDFLNVVFLHLEYHKNIFLLYRLSQALPLSQNEPLLSSAKAIIQVVTMLYTHRDRLGEMFLFFPWAVMFYGTPAAAILAIELLVRPYCLPAMANSGRVQARSEIIQEISIFISCLNSIPMTEGNENSCRRVASTLRKILDHVLESPSETMTNTSNSTASSTPATEADSAMSLKFDWQAFVTGPCDPEYTQWLELSTWTDLAQCHDFGIEDLGLVMSDDACFDDPFTGK